MTTKQSNIGKGGHQTNLKNSLFTKPIFSWALYDWANSAFATTIMAGLFPVFFKAYWSQGVDTSTSTFYLGLGNSISGALLAFSAPMLGAISDVSNKKKLLLFIFTALGVMATISLYLTPQGAWPWAITFYGLGALGFSGGIIFYDSLLINVASPEKIHKVSGLGYSLGYLGGGLLFALNVLTILNPSWFGWDRGDAVLHSFLSVAVWWTLFSIPLFLWVPEKKEKSAKKVIVPAFLTLKNTLLKLPSQPGIFIFLLAYLFYIDGVNTTIKMAVDYGMSLGFPSDSLITALLVTQFVGFPAALAFGYLGQKLSPKIGIFIAIFFYVGVILWAYFLSSTLEFYLMAGAIGLVQGGIQSLSRSYYGLIIPKESAGEFYGLYNMLGKFSSIVGPFLVGWVSLKTQSPRLSILVILVLFLIGGSLLGLQGKYAKKV